MKITLPQKDIYFEQLLYLNEPIYNIGAKIKIKGYIDIQILKKAYVELINQHDAYRTLLKQTQDEVSIQIIDEHNSELGFVDFSNFENQEEKANLYVQEEFLKPFDLLDDKLLHIFTLVKIRQDFYYLFSVYHHIITDGWGTSLMFQRLVQNYNEIYTFGEVKSDYPFSYKDFIKDDQEYQDSVSFIQDSAYWLKIFENLPENLLDKIDGTLQKNKSNREELIIKRKTYNKLNQLAKEYKSSTFHLILGILYTYFGKKHQNNDFAIGIPVLNRSKSSYKKTVGLFMGVSPLRIKLNFEAPFESLIADIKNQLRQDYRHQRFPLGKLIQDLNLFIEKERLFNITLSYEKQNYADNFINTDTKVIPLSHQSERVALAIYIREFDELEDVKIDFDYNLNYFDNLQITQVIHHFEILLDDILNHSNKKLKELSYLSKKEEHKIVVEFNNTKVDYPKDKTIIDLFREQVNKFPEKEAVKNHLKSFSYSELDKLSNQIAEYLIAAYGKEDKSPVTVLLERSTYMVVVLLGILKSGRSYIPLDSTFPLDRLNYIIVDSQTKILICENENVLGITEGLSVLTLENIVAGIDEFEGNIATPIPSTAIAYIIYTSGSTGNPKGVEIRHQSLTNFLTSIKLKPGINSNDLLFSVTTYSFDISILEFFAPLISGATLYIASQHILSEPNLIIKKMEEIKPTIIQATPSFYQMLFNAEWQGGKELKVLCGGDLLSESLAGKLLNNSLEVWNMYGPTETTIWSSIKKIEQSNDASNIGSPINNTQFYIVDSFLNPKPIGTPGAIYIAGDGLAKRYHRNDLLTKEKFIKNPFGDNSLFYETGDVGKWNANGEIEFLGRNDNQVKIRGYRIELGDIESQLNQISGIKDSVVIAKKGDQQEAFLIAFVLKNDEKIDEEEIIDALKILLPYYMIPNTIITLEKFPLTPNQKVDRKNLAQRAIQHDTKGKDFKVPASDLEKKLSGYWKEVLKKDESISINDNFFTLGGHSLIAVKLSGLIAKNLSFDITLKTIFDYPTIESMANYLQTLTPIQSILIEPSEVKDFYNLTPSQYNIWLGSQKRNISIAYNMFMAYEIDGDTNLTKIIQAINEIISKYEILRTNFIEINGIPYQKINSYENVQFAVSIDQLKEESAKEFIGKLINTEFDLENDLLLKTRLLQLEGNKSILVFCTHHIIMDGLSLEIFTKEFIKKYNENALIPEVLEQNTLKLHFKDYSEWLNKKVKDNAAKNESFWINYLKDYLVKDTVCRDFDSQKNQQRGGKYSLELTTDITLKLKELTHDNGITLYSILAASLNVLIYKFSNHKDICIGTVNSARNISELNDQMGMFASTLILRTKIDPEQTFIDLLKNTQNNLLEINDYQDIPFDKMQKSVFDVLLAYQNPEFSFDSINEINDFKLKEYPVQNNYCRMPLVFNFFESENMLKGIIDYNCDLFDEITIQIIAQKICRIINEIIKNPLMKVDSIDAKLELESNQAFNFDFNF